MFDIWDEDAVEFKPVLKVVVDIGEPLQRVCEMDVLDAKRWNEMIDKVNALEESHQ